MWYNLKVLDVSNHREDKKSKKDLGVAQLGARYLGVVEAASSSLVTQTISSVHNESDEHSIFFCLYLIVWSRISALFCYAVVGR